MTTPPATSPCHTIYILKYFIFKYLMFIKLIIFMLMALYNYDGRVNVITQVRLASGENVVKVRKIKKDGKEDGGGDLKKIMKQKG